jgi:ADP-ribose pyrophosphatase YjhB (NUDIX family)
MHCTACGARLPHLPPVACPACGTRHWRNAKPCAGAFVVHDGRLLLVRRAHEPWLDHWDIPGGFCDVEEHPADGAVREVYEETGLRVRVTGFLGIWIDAYGADTDGGLPTITFNTYYHAVPVGSVDVRIDPAEVAEVGWFAPDVVPERLAFPSHIAPAVEAWRWAMAAEQTVTPLLDLVLETSTPDDVR